MYLFLFFIHIISVYLWYTILFDLLNHDFLNYDIFTY